jgi:cytochrome c553
MRMSVFILLAAAVRAQAPSFQNVGTMSQLMIDIIYPASDAIFYIERAPPKNDVEWNVIRTQALMLAESGNLLMLTGRARDQGDWIKDSKMLIDAGAAAYKAAQAKDVNAILALNDQLNTACVTCHVQYRANFRKRP